MDEVKQSIEASARSEAKGIHESAQQESKRILDEAAQKAREIEQSYDKETREELERTRQEQLSAIERAARVSKLEAVDAAIRRGSESIRQELASRLRKSDGYARLFKEALKRAQEVAPLKDLVVQVSKQDEHFVAGRGAQIERANISGCVIYSKDRSVKIDATLDRLIDSSLEDAMTVILSEIMKKGNAAPRKSSRGGAPRARARAARKKATRRVTKRRSR